MARSHITISINAMIGAGLLTPLAIKNYPVRIHAYIAYPGEKYQDRQNYPGVDFRIDKKTTIFRLVPLWCIGSFLSVDQGDSCTSIKILWKY